MGSLPPKKLPYLPASYFHWTVATVFGSGFSSFAPGTVGSIVSLLIIYWIFPVSIPLQLIMLLGFTALAVYSSGIVAEMTETKDPSVVVADEFVGMFATFLFFPQPLRPDLMILGLVLFRIFDIWKPWPAYKLETLPGGFGIVLDDLVAGLYAMTLLHLADWWLL
ncbi:phosphatidylglycerophosphatase A family protein [Acanthopleuribacter pedis]|uniref:Phosphatidylglycerophosphatase A n=1 Tax=Acanthopleuribacter pedis TaxID=442870 RepID=A0A8J7U1Q9_9BACT|nr:phosphatidylglycerophosphatase A [Acanthopleuribacter pedis]MBO1316934.1 phosphatidylglycerophosphatase A [Acanthopleuribacter pedis]